MARVVNRVGAVRIRRSPRSALASRAPLTICRIRFRRLGVALWEPPGTNDDHRTDRDQGGSHDVPASPRPTRIRPRSRPTTASCPGSASFTMAAHPSADALGLPGSGSLDRGARLLLFLPRRRHEIRPHALRAGADPPSLRSGLDAPAATCHHLCRPRQPGQPGASQLRQGRSRSGMDPGRSRSRRSKWSTGVSGRCICGRTSQCF